MRALRPDRYVASLLLLDFRELLGQGVTTLLVDLDNTIAPRDSSRAPEPVASHLARALDEGMRLCIVTNNWHARCHIVARTLGLPIVTNALKPLPFGFDRARRLVGGTRDETLVVGDQVYTDVLGAHLAGLKVCLVRPLTDHDLPHVRVLRRLERRHLRDVPFETVPRPSDGRREEQTRRRNR